MSAALYGACSCSPWSMCSKHYAKYLSRSAERAAAKDARDMKRMAQQQSAERRKRNAKKRARQERTDSGPKETP